jgi:hypothetical protein
MKLFHTFIPDYGYASSAQQNEDGSYALGFVDSAGTSYGLTFTQETLFQQLPVEEREQRSDSMNFYIVITPNGLRVINKYSETYYSKSNGLLYGRQLQNPIVGQIYIPFIDSPISDWSIRLNSNAPLRVDGDFDVHPESTTNDMAGFESVTHQALPALRIVSVTPDGEGQKILVQLTLNGLDLARGGVRVYAKSACGYIANREIYTDESGQAEFLATRLNLQPEDQMIAEFGFRLRTNIVNVSVPA